jgi:hypothetical protein
MQIVTFVASGEQPIWGELVRGVTHVSRDPA